MNGTYAKLMNTMVAETEGTVSRGPAPLGAVLAAVALMAVALPAGQAAQGLPKSKWDQSLPSLELHGVNIEKPKLTSAWQEIATKYLIRSCLYYDLIADADQSPFLLNRESATGKDLMEAFIAAYPAYTYTQDPGTGVIWFHRKAVEYKDILSQRVVVNHSELQLPLWDILGSLSDLPELGVEHSTSLRLYSSLSFGIDLSAGTYAVRDIVNICCMASPTTGFGVSTNEYVHTLGIAALNLIRNDPLNPPRAAAVKFWEIEMGRGSNAIPLVDDIGRALGDPNPRKRWAAMAYYRAADLNYSRLALLEHGSDPNQAVLAVLALKYQENRSDPFLSNTEKVQQACSHNFARLRPGVALVGVAEMAKERNDTNIMNALSKDKLSPAELEAVKPELIRIARGSELVRKQFLKMNLADPDLSPEGILELGRTNLFSLAPAVPR